MVTVRQSPTVRRRRLGIELRRLREAAGLTIERVADSLECSDSKISRIETGQVGATPRDVRDMLELYGIAGEQREELVQIAREARQKGWWHAYGDVFTSPYVGFEAAATSILYYGPLLVPGLLQTVDYARSVIRALNPSLPTEEVMRRIELRMTRQALLTQDDPPAVSVILDEAVVRRPVGGAEVMREQLVRLVEAAAMPSVTLQVLPFTAGEHAGMDGQLTILQFAEPSETDLVFFETPARSELFVDEAEDVRHCTEAFGRLRAAALDPDETVALLTKLTKEL